jgi:DNA repair photolyase
MTKSKLTDYVINPYTGCQHGCKYCYADFIRRFQDIPHAWGEFVYAKINCPELLDCELKKNKPGNVFISSVCDCYMPLESKFMITRKILEKISKSQYKDKFTFEILTKSSLIRRDFDLLKNLKVELGCSINTLDSAMSKKIEPCASSPQERIKVLKEAKALGMKVYGFISPVLPGITDLEAIFKELAFCDYVWVELLNTQKSIMDRFMPFIHKEFPEKIKYFEYAVQNPNEYYKKIKEQVKFLEKKYKLKVKEVVVHNLR